MKICKITDCNNKQHAKGFCDKHYRIYLKENKTEICIVDGCNNKQITRGYCPKHYKRVRLYNDPLYTEKIYDHPDICTVDGCNNKYVSKGYCSKHLQRFEKYGDPLYSFFGRDRESHGLRNTPEYEIWAGMKARCSNEKHVGYHRYGGRGITVCDRWLHSFSNFLEDMGKRPEGNYQIDRINNNGNYEPSNCRWISCAENNQNRRSTKLSKEKAEEIRRKYINEKITHKQLSDIYNVHKSVITAILNNNIWK